MVAHRWFSRPVHSAALPYFRARVSLPGAPLNRTRNCATPGPSGHRVALEESTLVTLTGFGLCCVAKRGNPDTLRPKTLLAHSAGGRAGSESTLVTITGFGLCCVTYRAKPDTLRPKTLLAHSAGGRAGSESTLVTITGFGLCCVTYRAKPDTLRPKTFLAGPNATGPPKPVPRQAALRPASERARARPRPGPSIPRCPRPSAGCSCPAPCAAPGPATAPAG